MGFPITRTIGPTFLITGIYGVSLPCQLNYLKSDCFRSSVIFHFFGRPLMKLEITSTALCEIGLGFNYFLNGLRGAITRRDFYPISTISSALLFINHHEYCVLPTLTVVIKSCMRGFSIIRTPGVLK
jgi:hypothetical protein